MERHSHDGAASVVPVTSRMLTEAAEAPAVVARQWTHNRHATKALARDLRAHAPHMVLTIARGSSDNAATYARYLIETRLNVGTGSVAPSVSALFAARPAMHDVLALALSQSGRSPDLIAAADGAQQAGARLVALVNDADSPLAALGETLPLCAGVERSVAATKSFIATLASIAHLVATWAGDDELESAVHALPDTLNAAWSLDWSAAAATLARADHLLVLGRGPGLAVAQEAALKFKETSRLHAEAFSAAEVRHGPIALAGPAFPVLAFLPKDESRSGVVETLAACQAAGSTVLTVGGEEPGSLPMIDCHPALLPIAQAQAFYRLADAVAALRGQDPDAPPRLAKVTRTL